MLAWVSLVLVLAVAALRWPTEMGGDAGDYIRSTHDFQGSRFPPGFPVLLFPLSSSVVAMRLLGTAFTIALVVLIWVSAVKIAGWWAGVAAGVLTALSPVVTGQASLIMADAPAAALVIGALLALLHGKDKLAAVLIGVSAWLRIVQAAFAAALPRRLWLTCALVLGPLLLYNLVVNGSVTGYGPGQAEFGLRYFNGPVWFEQVGVTASHTNWQLYPLVLLGATGDVVPGLLVLGAVGIWRQWSRSALFAVKVAALNLVMYLFYYWQDPRFVLPATSLLLVYGSAAFGASTRGREAPDPPGSPTARRGSRLGSRERRDVTR